MPIFSDIIFRGFSFPIPVMHNVQVRTFYPLSFREIKSPLETRKEELITFRLQNGIIHVIVVIYEGKTEQDHSLL